jgi:hypothetical protein
VSLEFPLHDITENGGPVLTAYVATCSCSNSDLFTVFQVAGQNHFHIECAQCETSFCPFGACRMPAKIEARNPIHEEGGRWYFWDETWSNRHGPYPSEVVANEELNKYVRYLG